MSARAASAYANNQSETAVAASNSGEIIILIYDRIFDHLKVGKKALENGDYGIVPFTKAHDLIQQGLLACIDFETGGDIANSLGAVYEWSLKQIIAGRASKSPEKIQEVMDVLQPLYEAWIVLSPKEQIMPLSGNGFSLDNEVRSAA